MGVGILADFELFLVRVVPGVDADFLHPFRGLHGGVGFEMDVGDEWHLASGGAHLAGDVFQIGGEDFRLRGDANDLTTGIGKGEHFRDAGWGIAGVRGDH